MQPDTERHPAANQVAWREPHGAFATHLRELRERSRISQSKLADRAGMDHSYVSRLESGGRTPTREAVLNLAVALQLDESERDGLLAAAGFAPNDPGFYLQTEPVVRDLLGFLQDRQVSAEVRDDVRNMIALLVRQARRVPPARVMHFLVGGRVDP